MAASSVDRRKVLLMGKSGSGKTSMRSVIFAKDTKRLGATIDVEQSAVRFLGSLVLNLWDCGGQDAFLDNYLNAQKDTIFTNVAVLIYVFDITSHEWADDMQYFEDTLATLRAHSETSAVWVLINKMDLADQDDPGRIKYMERRQEVIDTHTRVSAEVYNSGPCRCFPTSIWDESLYKAWSSIIHTLIPNIHLITSHLTYLRNLALAVEAAIFESETFLIMAKSGSSLDADDHEHDDIEVASGTIDLDRQRFEKISDIVKAFRKTCQRTGEQFLGFETKFDGCTVVLEPLTKNTYVMIVANDKRIEPAMLQYLVHNAQLHFVEVGTESTLSRRCSVCQNSGDIRYVPDDDTSARVAGWDDPLPSLT